MQVDGSNYPLYQTNPLSFLPIPSSYTHFKRKWEESARKALNEINANPVRAIKRRCTLDVVQGTCKVTEVFRGECSVADSEEKERPFSEQDVERRIGSPEKGGTESILSSFNNNFVKDVSLIQASREESFDFLQLPAELICRIFSTLDHKALLQFERLAKAYQGITEPIWADYVRRACLDRLEWPEIDLPSNEEHPNKWRYCLSQAMIQYVVKERHPIRLGKSLEMVQKIKKRFGGIFKRFPCCEAYMVQDLARLGSFSQSTKQIHQKKLFKRLLGEKNKGGDYLLGALFEARRLKPVTVRWQKDFSKESKEIEVEEQAMLTKEYFTKAIQIGGAYAFLIAVSVLKDLPIFFQNVSFYKHLLKSCVLYDSEGLDYLLREYPDFAAFLYPNGYHFSKILFDHMQEELQAKQWPTAEIFCTKALQAYDGQVPKEFWSKAAIIKVHLNKWQEADVLYTQARNVLGRTFPKEELINEAYVKEKLKKWEEADVLYTQARNVWGGSISGEILTHIAHVKMQLKRWEEADALFNQAKNALGSNISVEGLINAAYVKMHLKKWEEADVLYTQIRNRYGSNIPAGVWGSTVYVKMQLKRWEEAEGVYAQARNALGNNIPLGLRLNVACAKKQLEKWEEAEKLYDNAIEDLKSWDQAEIASIWEQIGSVKKEVKKWEEALDYYERAIIAWGSHVPEKLQTDVAFVKAKLEGNIRANII
ncbi:tetratricopeptide repeat protein [Candidatus Protochlamydia phocaeensis]|uniref:tetratricopeptide repeat protein n=1 Tax=Candidatus Protochlamydia phocaeensis TaxID=1414722 RepID=UPI0008394200|nr:tetratricopeptide repeat protein [Candidatus Protochlamydia phocaeensis]